MSYLISSIIGQEFVNYRKTTAFQKRFIAEKNKLPIVIDSVDTKLSLALGSCSSSGAPSSTKLKYGKEFSIDPDATVSDLLSKINKLFYITSVVNGKSPNTHIKLILGLENGSLLKSSDIFKDIYGEYYNKKDRILYLLLTKETTMYSYIISILRYLGILSKVNTKDNDDLIHVFSFI
jgi:hypothetical protein